MLFAATIATSPMRFAATGGDHLRRDQHLRNVRIAARMLASWA
jgi:predicted YcjX-like family ATPase